MELTEIHPGILIVYYLILTLSAFLFSNPYYMITFIVLMLFLIYLQGVRSELVNVMKIFIPLGGSSQDISLGKLFHNIGSSCLWIPDGWNIFNSSSSTFKLQQDGILSGNALYPLKKASSNFHGSCHGVEVHSSFKFPRCRDWKAFQTGKQGISEFRRCSWIKFWRWKSYSRGWRLK